MSVDSGPAYHLPAEEQLRRALAAEPQRADLHRELGVLLWHGGRAMDALQMLRRARALDGSDPEVLNSLGYVLWKLEQWKPAERRLREAIALRPDFGLAHLNLGRLLRDRLLFRQAEASLRATVRVLPDSAAAMVALGHCLLLQGRAEEAQAMFRAATLLPDARDAWANLAISLQYTPQADPASVLEVHRRAAASLPAGVEDRHRHDNAPVPARRLRLGYVSGDFRRHSVAYFIAPVLEAHDRDAFELFLYSGVERPDETTRRFRELADHYCAVDGWTDSALADQVRRDAIDVLVDLSGWSGQVRLGCFAARPAPVQLTYLGYPDTTGLDSVDIRITDAWADPEDDPTPSSERLARLPSGFLAYEGNPELAVAQVPPCQRGGPVTFGSFNNLAKVTPRLLEVWAEILRQVPGSRLFLKSKAFVDTALADLYRSRLAALGVAADRVRLQGWSLTPQEHLALYAEVDIALDTFPYNGTTTTCEALWMGVPVVTLRGRRHAGRVGVSLLQRAGLGGCVASDETGYIDRAVALARDERFLASMRRGLREQVQGSQLCDAAAVTRDLEHVYRSAWQDWCRAQATADPG